MHRVLNVIAENRIFAVAFALIARYLDRFRRLIVDGAEGIAPVRGHFRGIGGRQNHHAAGRCGAPLSTTG